jgi:uncharacterized membrane protein YfcA
VLITYLILIGLFAGIIKGSTGFGSSLIAVPLLFLVGYTSGEIVTMMITTNIVLNILLIYENKSYFHLGTIKKIYPIILGGIIFTGLGLFFNENINAYVIELIAAGLIFVAIINKVTSFKLSLKDTKLNLFIVGIFSGIGNGLASIDGPPVVFYLTGINAEKRRFKSTLATHFLVMGIIGFFILLYNGNYTIDILKDTLYLFGSLVVGLIGGMAIGKKLNEERFQKFVLVVLFALMISLIIP